MMLYVDMQTHSTLINGSFPVATLKEIISFLKKGNILDVEANLLRTDYNSNCTLIHLPVTGDATNILRKLKLVYLPIPVVTR